MTLLSQYHELFNWIKSQQSQMASLVQSWANINSGSENLFGLARMRNKILHTFIPLKGKRSILPLQSTPAILPNGELSLRKNGDAILIRQRPKAPLRVLLGGHMDTVFVKDSSFQTCRKLSDDRMEGPGVADMKGGLIVMLFALLAFEKSPYSEIVGWDVLVTPDEEQGSSASASLWKQYAWQNHLALLFEPALSDGSIVSERKGSSNYYVIAQGVKAHAGRDYTSGKNAIAGLAEFIVAAHALNSSSTVVNVGIVQGGEAINVVPDKSYCTVNVRTEKVSELNCIEKKLKDIAHTISFEKEITLEIYLKSYRPPKPITPSMQNLMSHLENCADFFNMDLKFATTGGVCDGNLTAAEGLPTLDTLGVVGGALHTDREWIWLPSLSERACLATALLISLAQSAPSTEFFYSKTGPRKPYE